MEQIINVENLNDVVITAKVKYEGKLLDVNIVKFDKKNGVVSFTTRVFGKNMYFPTSATSPKMKDFKDVVIAIKPAAVETE